MNAVNTGDVLFSTLTLFSLLFSVIPIIFFVWFAITTTSQLKKQTALLEEVKNALKQDGRL